MKRKVCILSASLPFYLNGANRLQLVEEHRSNQPKKQARTSKKQIILTIPAELQNKIFELVLIEDYVIDITAHGPIQPGLLRVNRALRQQWTSFYYTFNRFNVIVTEHDIRGIQQCPAEVLQTSAADRRSVREGPW